MSPALVFLCETPMVQSINLGALTVPRVMVLRALHTAVCCCWPAALRLSRSCQLHQHGGMRQASGAISHLGGQRADRTGILLQQVSVMGGVCNTKDLAGSSLARVAKHCTA